jgi:hypothetical protein
MTWSYWLNRYEDNAYDFGGHIAVGRTRQGISRVLANGRHGAIVFSSEDGKIYIIFTLI